MKTNNLTETFYHTIDSGLRAYIYRVLDCPKEHVNLVCNMLSNFSRLCELELIHESHNGCNIFEEERRAAEFDLTTFCYTEHITLQSVCLEQKDLADLIDSHHKTIPEYTYNKQEF